MVSFSFSARAECVDEYEALAEKAVWAKRAGGVGVGVAASGGVGAVGGVGAAVMGKSAVLLSLTGWGLVIVAVTVVGGIGFAMYQNRQEQALHRQMDVLKIYQQAKTYLSENPVITNDSPRMPLDLAVFVGTLNPTQDFAVAQQILEGIVAAMDHGTLCSSSVRLFNSLDLHLLIQSKIMEWKSPRLGLRTHLS